jgi:hypothetical protein
MLKKIRQVDGRVCKIVSTLLLNPTLAQSRSMVKQMSIIKIASIIVAMCKEKEMKLLPIKK